MIKLLLILFLPLLLNASKILSYNIYDRTDRADIMITFDTPYHGKIRQTKNNSKIIIKLYDTSIESSKVKKLSSAYLNSIIITPMSKLTQIVASVPENIVLKASKTSDSYGLRLRFIKSYAKKKITSNNNMLDTSTSLPTKKDDGFSKSYYIVIAILIIGIIILFILNKKIASNIQNKKTDKWLFKENVNQDTNVTKDKEENEEVSIKFQKRISSDSNVLMLEVGTQNYLILMGNNNNVLLDKFTDNKPSTQSDFDIILQDRHEQLTNYFNKQDIKIDNKAEESLQSYKEKAGIISYQE